jgi:hypothetical protein
MADIVDLGAATRRLRGPDAETARRRRIAIHRQAAFRRARMNEYSDADLAMFGPIDRILSEGPGADPRLHGGAHP